ncbi:major capsid protein P2 [Roseateles sp.]|uniref:major capsid protein P2 n=1 Tax=Roseateles sp. TaxID=1971397 RepID=UPI002E014B68|nr:major capsid protein P2 [Roseateles sp.]
MGFKVQLTNLQNVAPGNVATLKVPVGPGAPTYDQVKLVLGGGLTPAKITNIRGKANGRIFLDESGNGATAVQQRDAYRGIFNDATEVVLDFTERNARNGAAEQLVAAVPGSLLQDLSFEITLDATAPAGSTITAIANYRPPTTNPNIRKLLTTTQAFAAAGTTGAPNIMYLPVGGQGGKLKRVWIRESVAGVITHAQIRIANNVVFDADRAVWEYDQKRNLLVPQAGLAVLDFIEDGNLAGMLDTGSAPNVELRLTTSAAATFGVDYEFLDPIGRL